MGSFRRVEGEEAGPDALGILVPPGKRTFVILRPRLRAAILHTLPPIAPTTISAIASSTSAIGQGGCHHHGASIAWTS